MAGTPAGVRSDIQHNNWAQTIQRAGFGRLRSLEQTATERIYQGCPIVRLMTYTFN